MRADRGQMDVPRARSIRAVPALAVLVVALAVWPTAITSASPVSARAGRTTAESPAPLLPGTERWADLILRAAAESGVPWHIIDAVLFVASGGNPIARTPSGGAGLMAIGAADWSAAGGRYGTSPWDPWANVRAAADALAQRYARLGDWAAAAADYLATSAQPADATDVHRRLSTALHALGFVGPVPLALPSAPPGAFASDWSARALEIALLVQGMPYLWGGADPSDGGFDCSGLVQWSFAAAGVWLPRTAAEQWLATARIAAEDVRAGDLVFFANTNGPGITHVGIYVGDGWMLNAPAEGDVVRLMSLDDAYWRRHLAGFGRVGF